MTPAFSCRLTTAYYFRNCSPKDQMILRLYDAIVLLDGALTGIIDNNIASDSVKRFPSV